MKIDTKDMRRWFTIWASQQASLRAFDMIDRIDELESCIKNLKIADQCWCERAIGNPMYRTHSESCIAAQRAMGGL